MGNRILLPLSWKYPLTCFFIDISVDRADENSLNCSFVDHLRDRVERNQNFSAAVVQCLDEVWYHDQISYPVVSFPSDGKASVTIDPSTSGDCSVFRHTRHRGYKVTPKHVLRPPLWLIQSLIGHPFIQMREAVSFHYFTCRHPWHYSITLGFWRCTIRCALFVVGLTVKNGQWDSFCSVNPSVNDRRLSTHYI